MNRKKLFIYGLDCATPQLLFDKYLDELPCFKKLISSGKAGLLKSTNPPVTVPAWMSMFTGKDPGQLGFYGFIDRSDYSYDNIHIVNHNNLNDKAVWDSLGEAGLKSIVLGVPPTYPPKPVNGIMIADFLTPDRSLDFTYPESIKAEINEICGNDYIIDVENFRMEDKKKLLSHIYDMTEKRFKIIKSFIKNKEWDLFIASEIGLDRLHHGYWKYCFKDHAMFEEGNEFENSIKDYYKFIDKELSEVVKLLDDNTEIMVVSDHGAKGSKGSFCLNQWLIENNYLVLKDPLLKKDSLEKEDIDWPKTKAWAKAGYYGRIFFNIAGREPEGAISKSDVAEFEKEIKDKLSKINGVENEVLSTKEIYKETKNIPPDLLFYCGKLDYRVNESVGNADLFEGKYDSGSDNANHDFCGIVIISNKSKGDANLKEYSICDIAPTILEYFNLKPEDNLAGKKIE